LRRNAPRQSGSNPDATGPPFKRPDPREKEENHLDKKLHQLETFNARGSDGRTYTVRGYEHLARLETMGDPHGLWEPTGEAEYKLDDGRPVRVDRNGDMTVIGTDLTLRR
jgi:hypothetical protein